jgi:hypothetical protein
MIERMGKAVKSLRERFGTGLPARGSRRAATLLVALLACAPASGYAGPLDTAELNRINVLYRHLIEAENRHDLAAVRKFMWESADTLFVAKTATPAEGSAVAPNAQIPAHAHKIENVRTICNSRALPVKRCRTSRSLWCRKAPLMRCQVST